MDRRLFSEGRWQQGESWAELRSPFDDRLLSRVAQASRAQVDAALQFAQQNRARVAAQPTQGGHRGQVALLLLKCGAEPPPDRFTHYLRLDADAA